MGLLRSRFDLEIIAGYCRSVPAPSFAGTCLLHWTLVQDCALVNGSSIVPISQCTTLNQSELSQQLWLAVTFSHWHSWFLNINLTHFGDLLTFSLKPPWSMFGWTAMRSGTNIHVPVKINSKFWWSVDFSSTAIIRWEHMLFIWPVQYFRTKYLQNSCTLCLVSSNAKHNLTLLTSP